MTRACSSSSSKFVKRNHPAELPNFAGVRKFSVSARNQTLSERSLPFITNTGDFKMKYQPPIVQPLIYLPEDLRALGIKKSNTNLLRWEALKRFPRRMRLGGTSV